ncbi:MAG: ABC transporter ATP-binding protein [Candidatus Kaiserbacteria bacterium]|nr:ABC transporter ATP-binding protein [Candidatus Kaiserbacteria bacterium]MCB9816454.1 ABC transporter ATP-binding protein [Candidatus Nomurabacteria bacterium]
MIEARKLWRVYNDGQVQNEVLKGIDLSVAPGEFVAIMGRSGAGKSTLLYQLSALDTPSAGKVVLDGQDLQALSATALNEFRLKTMGYVFQDYALIPDLSALENILTPLLMRGQDWDTAAESAREALRHVGLAGKEDNRPAELSGGEQQRVSIARAIAGNPKILFADEPTANLDSRSGQQVIEQLRALHHAGQTIVMVTHEAEYTKYCDRVVTLEDGMVIKITAPFQNGSVAQL